MEPTGHELPDAVFDQLNAAYKRVGRPQDFLVRERPEERRGRWHGGKVQTYTAYGKMDWADVLSMIDGVHDRFEHTAARREGFAPGGKRYHSAEEEFNDAKRPRSETAAGPP